MKKFLSSVLASIIGCSIVLGILFFFSMVMFGIMVASISLGGEEKFVLKDNTILKLDLSGTLSDRVVDNPLMAYLGTAEPKGQSLEDMLEAIKKAKDDNKIEGIYIKAGMFSASSASLKELRDALIDYKESDKFLIAYGDIYTQGSYYLSSIADKVIVNPSGSINIQGMSSTPMFYTGLLENVGVEMQIFKVGTFKSAVEPFIEKKMSDANRQQVESYVGDIWNTTTTAIAESRNMSVAKVNEIADMLPMMKKKEFMLENNLADTLMYETEVDKYLKTLVGLGDSDKTKFCSPKNMKDVAAVYSSNSSNVVAVLFAEGEITQGTSREGITDGALIKEIEKLRKDKTVKAVVFRVNSPGGSAFASEQIWKAITDLKAEKPVVVSMGDYAASGGYYIACNASKIYAQPNTLTGSIGIFGMFPNMQRLVGKVGLTFDNVKTNKFADFGDISRPMTMDEKAFLQSYVEDGYDLFLQRCADGRSMTKEQIDAVGQGRVWTGNQALANGLIDAIGGMDDAVVAAAELAELDYDYKTISYPKQLDFFQIFLMSTMDDYSTAMMKEKLGMGYEAYEIMRKMNEADVIQARLPYDLRIE